MATATLAWLLIFLKGVRLGARELTVPRREGGEDVGVGSAMRCVVASLVGAASRRSGGALRGRVCRVGKLAGGVSVPCAPGCPLPPWCCVAESRCNGGGVALSRRRGCPVS